MNQLSRLIFFLVVLSTSKSFSQIPITAYGELRAIMQRGDLSAKVRLDTISEKLNTLGLGVAEGLKGEIVIVGGVSYVSTVVNGKVVTEIDPKIAAAMLVTADIWGAHTKLYTEVKSLKHLEELLESHAKDKQFAFVLDSVQGDISYHIIDWDANTVHTAENHKKFALHSNVNLEYASGSVFIVGFYSTKPGIFTPHTSKIHLHALLTRTRTVGHIDDVKFDKAILYIF